VAASAVDLLGYVRVAGHRVDGHGRAFQGERIEQAGELLEFVALLCAEFVHLLLAGGEAVATAQGFAVDGDLLAVESAAPVAQDCE
ncbi:MAG: hypothetical protein ACI957_004359, partial [Verrucomicrobiales bacterium]